MNAPIPAVILAGGQAGEALATQTGAAYKALLPVKGQPMVTYVANALAEAHRVGQVFLVGPAEVAEKVRFVAHLPDAGSFLGNLVAGVSACGEAPYCLVITCDIPMVTGTIVDEFVALAVARQVDLAYPIIELWRCRQRFPTMGRTSLRIREGRFTGGNAVVMRPAFLARNAALIEEAFAARKQPLRLAQRIGWGVLARLLVGVVIPQVLPLRLIEERIGQIVGGQVAAIPLPYPEIGADIDKPEDWTALEGSFTTSS